MIGSIDLGALRKAHAELSRGMGSAIRVSLEKAGKQAEEHVRLHSKFKRRSAGNSLKDATTHRVTRRDGSKSWRLAVISKKRTARFLEHGTAPHLIKARRRKMLRFVANGKVMFRRQVRHPGTKATHFLWRATQSAARVFEQSVESRMQSVIRRIG